MNMICSKDILSSIPWLQFAKNIFLAFTVFAILYVICDLVGVVGPKPIKGIPTIPGFPIVGNLFQVLNNPAKRYIEWAHIYKSNVYQVRLGSKYIVLINSFKDISEFSSKFGRCLDSRPKLYVFHNLLSSTQGFTIGSSPSGPSYLRKKKTISQYLNIKSIKSYLEKLNIESNLMLKELIKSAPELYCLPTCRCPSCQPNILLDINIGYFVQLFVLKLALDLSYGLQYDVYCKHLSLANEIIKVENEIIKIRSPTSSFQDYFPILRIIPHRLADQCRYRRDSYINGFRLQSLKGTSNGDNNVISSIVGDLTTSNLSAAEIRSICLTMVSAGLDNTPLVVNHLMGHLSHKYGIKMQELAFKDLLNINDGDVRKAWNSVCLETRSTYVEALLLEALRYFTVLPLGLPREVSKDIVKDNILIPKGTMVIFNLFSANHDSEIFENPHEFDPTRWIDATNNSIKTEFKQLCFGLGSRRCAGDKLAMKEMYVVVCRIILLFKIKSPKNLRFLMKLDPFEGNANPTATSFEPYPFKVRLEKRKYPGCDDFYLELL